MLRRRNRRREGWGKMKRGMMGGREGERESIDMHGMGNGRQREEGHVRHAEGEMEIKKTGGRWWWGGGVKQIHRIFHEGGSQGPE